MYRLAGHHVVRWDLLEPLIEVMGSRCDWLSTELNNDVAIAVVHHMMSTVLSHVGDLPVSDLRAILIETLKYAVRLDSLVSFAVTFVVIRVRSTHVYIIGVGRVRPT